MTQTALIERFYHEVWNRADEAAAREILAPDFRFRGSLGPEKRGVDGFLDYTRQVHAALSGYTCTIIEIIEQNARAAVRLRFGGVHRGPFFGVAATGRDVSWSGAAFFGFADGRIAELWVLGDVDAVKAQLGAEAEVGAGVGAGVGP